MIYSYYSRSPFNSSGAYWTSEKCFKYAQLFTSEPAPCLLILSLLHGKQNLWWGTDGHCTKWVSSNLSWQRVHFKVVVGVGVATFSPLTSPSVALAMPPASVDVTVVEETCLDPEDLRPLDDPAEQGNIMKTLDFITQIDIYCEPTMETLSSVVLPRIVKSVPTEVKICA